MSQCVYAYIPSLPWPLTSTLFSCNGFSSGSVDCLHATYTQFTVDGGAQVALLIASLNLHGNGYGASVTLNATAWTHVCLTFELESGTVVTYVNAEPVSNFTTQHTVSSYGTPVADRRRLRRPHAARGGLLHQLARLRRGADA